MQGFRRERLQTAVSRLRERLKEVRAQEENQRRWTAYLRVKADRDKFAAELKASYPSMESWLGELIAKIEANDREIEYINGQALPMGAERLRSAELIARGIEAWRVNSTDECGSVTNCAYLPSNTIRTGRTHGRVNDSTLAFDALSRRRPN